MKGTKDSPLLHSFLRYDPQLLPLIVCLRRPCFLLSSTQRPDAEASSDRDRSSALPRSVQQLFCSSPAPSLPPSLGPPVVVSAFFHSIDLPSAVSLSFHACALPFLWRERDRGREGGALLCSGVAADAAEGRLAAAVFLLPSSLTPRETGLRATK